jgi:hypothetical protein
MPPFYVYYTLPVGMESHFLISAMNQWINGSHAILGEV